MQFLQGFLKAGEVNQTGRSILPVTMGPSTGTLSTLTRVSWRTIPAGR